MLDETLGIWGGELNRTPMNEARDGSKKLGRDHQLCCFTIWMAGAGVRKGFRYGATDERGYQITEGATSVRDHHAPAWNGLLPAEVPAPRSESALDRLVTA